MTNWEIIWTGAVGNALGGAIVALIFFITDRRREIEQEKTRIIECHAIIQSELQRHASVASEYFEATPKQLSELPDFDTAALRIIPLMGKVKVVGEIHRFIRLSRYIDEVQRLNSVITTLRGYYGSGGSIVFEGVDERERLSVLIKDLLRQIKDQAIARAVEFPTSE